MENTYIIDLTQFRLFSGLYETIWSKEGKTTMELESDFNNYVDSISDLNEYGQLFVYDYNGEGDTIKSECFNYIAFVDGVWYDIKSDFDNVWLEKDGIKC